MTKKFRTSVYKYYRFLLQAQLAFACTNDQEGIYALQQALALSRTKGYIYLPGIPLPVLARLCARALEAGVEVEQVRFIIQRLKLKPENPVLTTEKWPWPVKIQTLGRFALEVNERPVEFGRKAPRGPLLLLKALIAFGGHDARATRLADTLWPDADGAASLDAFTTTLARLRKLLGQEKAVQLRDGQVSLDPQWCWVDCLAFIHDVDEAEAAVVRKDVQKALEFSRNALKLYQGAFLATESEEPWMLPMRERLRNRYIKRVNWCVNYWTHEKEWEPLVNFLEKAIDAEPFIKSFYKQLVNALQKLDRMAEVKAVKDRQQAMLHG